MYRNGIHEFSFTVTGTTDIHYLLKTHNLYKKMSLAFEMGLKVIRLSLGHESNSEKSEMIPTCWIEKELEQGIKLPGSVGRMFACNLRCDDRRNRLLPMTIETIVKMRILNEFSKTGDFLKSVHGAVRDDFLHTITMLCWKIYKESGNGPSQRHI